LAPLTPGTYARLSDSANDASRTELHQIAAQRGVVFGEGSHMKLDAKLAGETAVQYLSPTECTGDQ